MRQLDLLAATRPQCARKSSRASANNWRCHSRSKICSGDSVGDSLLLNRLELDAATALLPVRGGVLIGGESFHGHAKVGTERTLRGVETREEVPLQCGREEALRQIFGVLVALAEFDADESIDRFPVQRHHAFQGVVRQAPALRHREGKAGWKGNGRAGRPSEYPHPRFELTIFSKFGW